MAEEVQLSPKPVLASKQQAWLQFVPWADALEPDHGLVLLPEGLEHPRHAGHRPHLLPHDPARLVGRPPRRLFGRLVAARVVKLRGELGRQGYGAVLVLRQRGPVDLHQRVGQRRQLRHLLLLVGGGLLEDVEEHLRDLLDHKGHAPSEDVHEVREVVGVGRAVELQDVQRAVGEFQDRAFVVVDVAVVRRREDRDDRGEARLGVRLVHLVALELRLVRPDHGEEAVLLQELHSPIQAEVVGAPSNLIVHERRPPPEGGLLLPLLRLQRVRPQQVAQQALPGRLLEPIDAVDGLHVRQLRRQPAVHHEELPVDRGC
mmetsp:Transcript_13461/g.38280  ORF Transcript_13461/g.38280 Transcript_13461/m.38280 type:complete len:316 (-) Transcript_13461:203-1150(-)